MPPFKRKPQTFMPTKLMQGIIRNTHFITILHILFPFWSVYLLQTKDRLLGHSASFSYACGTNYVDRITRRLTEHLQENRTSWPNKEPTKNRQTAIILCLMESDRLISINQIFHPIYTFRRRPGKNGKGQVLPSVKTIQIHLNNPLQIAHKQHARSLILGRPSGQNSAT